MKKLKFQAIVSKISKNPKIRILIFSLFCIVFLICITSIILYYGNQSKASEVYDDIKKTVDITDHSQESTEVQAKKIDFDALWAINKEIYAYIEIPGTDISYPILQRETDNSYYLNYTVDGTYGLPGSIYTENYNTRKFVDRNTVIYGHNMNNGTMFAQLYKYSDQTFFEMNPYVYIYLPDKTLKYQIFAAVMFDDRHILGNFDSTKVQNFMAYLNVIDSLNDSRCQRNTSIHVTENDKIITLSTCMPTDMPNNRWLVEAVLVDE